MPNAKFRPPHMPYKIREMIKLRKFDEAQKMTDENVAFYDAKIGEQQDLFLEAQCGKMGLKYSPENKLAVSANTPKRRIPNSRTFGSDGHA